MKVYGLQLPPAYHLLHGTVIVNHHPRSIKLSRKVLGRKKPKLTWLYRFMYSYLL